MAKTNFKTIDEYHSIFPGDALHSPGDSGKRIAIVQRYHPQ
jgi:hypothetical protein